MLTGHGLNLSNIEEESKNMSHLNKNNADEII
jgi:hypothetical protein